MSKMSKRKGKAGEREFTKLLSTLLGNISRKRRVVGLPAISAMAIATPEDNGSDIYSIPGLSIEVKRQETLSVGSWWNQTVRQAENDGGIPVLAYRRNREKWTIVLPAYLLGVGIDGYITCSVDTFENWLYNYLED
jgi:Holliday junction resolvase